MAHKENVSLVLPNANYLDAVEEMASRNLTLFLVKFKPDTFYGQIVLETETSLQSLVG